MIHVIDQNLDRFPAPVFARVRFPIDHVDAGVALLDGPEVQRVPPQERRQEYLVVTAMRHHGQVPPIVADNAAAAIVALASCSSLHEAIEPSPRAGLHVIDRLGPLPRPCQTPVLGHGIVHLGEIPPRLVGRLRTVDCVPLQIPESHLAEIDLDQSRGRGGRGRQRSILLPRLVGLRCVVYDVGRLTRPEEMGGRHGVEGYPGQSLGGAPRLLVPAVVQRNVVPAALHQAAGVPFGLAVTEEIDPLPAGEEGREGGEEGGGSVGERRDRGRGRSRVSGGR
mmetsp:Transcript_56318/g.168602  ORF Transcript_56318/g.168602 Transcript_56318/m.168602 type:complete len:280 (+) Transcript_56318:609-1448(+)